MEDYVAADVRPVDKCLADVRSCDVYVGLFAWRYGYVVPDLGISITELEFREALAHDKPCLLFLLDAAAPWPRNRMDRDPAAIEALRHELRRDHLVSFFSRTDQLSGLVTAAVATLGQGAHEDGKLQIADIVVIPPGPTLDIKLYNPGDSVVFLTEMALNVLERHPYFAVVQPSATYDLLIDGPRNALPISHEIPPQRAERILVRTAAGGMYSACALTVKVEFTFNGGKKLTSDPFGID
jgi:hypothetical protein